MTQVQCKYGLFENTGHSGVMAESLRVYGEFAERWLSVVRRFIGPGYVVVEIGAEVGATAIACARFVGDRGLVYALEARADLMTTLRANISRNFLQDVALTPHPSESSSASSETSLFAAVESLELSRVDFVHVARDVSAVLPNLFDSARLMMTQNRPVVCVDLASSQIGEAWFNAALDMHYLVFGHQDFAFNPDNYFGHPENVYGETHTTSLFLIPTERVAQLYVSDLRAIDSLEDLHNALRDLQPASIETAEFARTARTDPWTTLRETVAGGSIERPVLPYHAVCSARELHLVVPFYKKEELVPQLFGSLNAIGEELRAVGAKVFFYNDSPEYPALQAALDRCRFDQDDIPFEVVRNEANLGFIGTCNRAFSRAKGARADVVLLNSDTIVFPGALREMLEVAKLDPMVGFVSPRSNNATLASLPHSFLDQDVTPRRGYAAFVQNAGTLPRYSFVPTAVGFCLLVKWTVHSELGAFDPIYATGYNEENDLIMRANRCGYRAVLANRAFVWHQGEQSFAESSRAKAGREARNAPILHKRYPEYPQLIYTHFASPEYRAENLLEYVEAKDGEFIYAFDFSSFGAYFNGTFESGIKLLDAAVRNWPKHYRIAVYMQRAAWDFHGLSRLEHVKRLEVDDPANHDKVTAIVRVGQPFNADAMVRVANRAPVVGVFMLDTISFDCGYLSLTFDARIWHFTFRHIDVLFTNSRFTLDRMASRFAIGSKVIRTVSLHSLDTSEYGTPARPSEGVRPHIFVIGNHFSHKFVRPTVDALAVAFPHQRIVAVGYGDDPSPHPNVEVFQAGNLPEHAFEKFYSDSEAVIFPSHYEGFGFPILHALGRRRPIYVRDSALYREIVGGVEGAENVHFFCTTDDLVGNIRANGMRWMESTGSGERAGWDRSAREVFNALEQARRTVTYDTLVDRLREVDQLMLATKAVTTMPTAGKRVGMKVEAAVDRVLRVPGLRPLARRGWNVVRRVRRLR